MRVNIIALPYPLPIGLATLSGGMGLEVSYGRGRSAMKGVGRNMQRMLAAFLISVPLAMAPTRARPAADEAGRDWERLSDGRVVIDIYGRRLAFSPDLAPGMVVFQHGGRDVQLRDVIAQPSEMRRWWAPSHPTMPVAIALSANFVMPRLFEGASPVNQAAVAIWSPFWVWIYREHGTTYCEYATIDRQFCSFFLARSRDDTAINRNGFIVEEPEALRGIGRIYYLFPERERRAPPGDPAHIACRNLQQSLWCMNGTARRWGSFIQPGIFMRYQYSMSQANPQDMRAIDTAFRKVVTNLLLDRVEED